MFAFVFQLMFAGLVAPQVAHAFDTETGEVNIFAQLINAFTQEKVEKKVEKTTKKLEDTIFKGLVQGVSITLKNALNKLTQQYTEKFVKYMATGEWGQEPKWYTTAWKVMEEDVLNRVVGTMLDNVNDRIGLDICNPSNYNLKIQLMVGLGKGERKGKKDYDDKKVDCTWDKFQGNWKAWYNT